MKIIIPFLSLIIFFLSSFSSQAETPPPLVNKLVERRLETVQEAEVPGAIIHISTPSWEGTWTQGTADLKTGRPIEADDYFRIASISKTFTANVVLQLVDEGILNLEDKLSKFNGGFGVALADQITLKQLFQHTSGLGDWQESTGFQISSCSQHPDDYLLVNWSPQSMVELSVSVGHSQPGTGFDYEDINYVLLGMVVEWVLQGSVTSTRLPMEIEDRILVPLGLDQTIYPLDSSIPSPAVHGYWIPAEFDDWCPSWSNYTGLHDGSIYNPSREFGCGAIISTLSDLKTWCQALARGTLISPEAHKEQLTWGRWPAPSGGYGLGIMSVLGAIGHGGDFSSGYSSAIYYLPAHEAIIIVLLNRDSFNATYLAAQLIMDIFPPAIPPRPAGSDFNGNGKADLAFFRPQDGLWKVRGLGRASFGDEQDIPVPGDYDGDGYTDLAFFRPSSGLWEIRNLTHFYFGQWRDTPVPADYDGDGCCDYALFRDVTGLWQVRGNTQFYFGQQFDCPVIGDFNGDGTARAAIFRPSSLIKPSAGLWIIRDLTRFYFGKPGDFPAPGVYSWYDPLSESGPFPLQAGFFRPEKGLWTIRGQTRFYLGRFGDIPIPADFQGNSLAEPAVFRPTSGLWIIRDQTRLYFGKTGDLPLSR